MIDWRVDRPENRDPALYFDETHYRHPIAERVENEIAPPSAQAVEGTWAAAKPPLAAATLVSRKSPEPGRLFVKGSRLSPLYRDRP